MPPLRQHIHPHPRRNNLSDYSQMPPMRLPPDPTDRQIILNQKNIRFLRVKTEYFYYKSLGLDKTYEAITDQFLNQFELENAFPITFFYLFLRSEFQKTYYI